MIERLIWLVPFAVAILGAWRPRAGLVAFVAALPLFGSPPGGPYLAALDLAAVAAVLTAWRGGRPARSPLALPAAAFVVVSLVSLVPLVYLPPSWRPEMLVGLLRALPSVESWSALQSWRAAADLLLGWALFLSVRRAFAGHSLRPLGYAVAAGLGLVLLVGLASTAGLLSLEDYRPRYGRIGATRMTSLFFLSGWLAEYVIVATPVAVAALAAASRSARRLAVALVALALACVALTLQRGAWVAAAVQVVFVLAAAWHGSQARRSRVRRVALSGAAALAVGTMVLLATGDSASRVLERARSVRSGFSARTQLWSAAADMARDRPLLGSGLGTFAPAYDQRNPPGSAGARPFRSSAHNMYLHVAAERGILGLLALGLVAGAAVSCLRRPRPGDETLALALGASLIGVACYGLVQHMLYVRNIAWLIWILLGCTALVTTYAGSARAIRAARLLAAAALLLVPIRAILYEPYSFAGTREFGLHATEGTPESAYRWTEGRAALRVPWQSETLVLAFYNGHPLGAERPVQVNVRVNGGSHTPLTVRGGWEEYRFDLGPPVTDHVTISLAVDPTFRPFHEYRTFTRPRRSVDVRSLGVAMKAPNWD